MVTVGIDVGSLSTKVVLLNNDKVVSYAIYPTGVNTEAAVDQAMESAMEKAGISSKDKPFFVATGAGKKKIAPEKQQATEVICDTIGSLHINPKVTGIIDIGGETCRAIKCDLKGNIIDFAMNDKCASGTGIFLDAMAKALRVKPEEMGDISMKSDKDIEVTSMCAVFAESEVVSMIHRKVPKHDILKGIHKSIASRIYGLTNRILLEGEIIATGGIANNIGVVSILNELMNTRLNVPKNPEIVGAIGAAILAKERS